MVTRAGLVRELFSVIVLAVRYDLVFDVLDEHVRIGITHFGLRKVVGNLGSLLPYLLIDSLFIIWKLVVLFKKIKSLIIIFLNQY